MALRLARAEKALRWGYNAAAFPRWTIKEADGTWKGFDVDIMNALCMKPKIMLFDEPISAPGAPR